MRREPMQRAERLRRRGGRRHGGQAHFFNDTTNGRRDSIWSVKKRNLIKIRQIALMFE